MPPTDWNSGSDELRKLSTPAAIQGFLDELPYNPGVTCRSPARVLRERTANCMEGALFAAACLERIGYPPRLINFIAVRDDDHVIAVFEERGQFGSVAKSNYSGLRYRNPVYRSIRELVLSYFEDYFNQDGELTLRLYTRPLALSGRRYEGWQSAADVDYLSDALDAQPRTRIIPPDAEPRLRDADGLLLRAGLLDADPEGLYRT